MNRCLMLLGTLAISLVAVAHHSPNVHFDRGDIVEISGRLAEIQWQNPHTLLISRRLQVVAVPNAVIRLDFFGWIPCPDAI